MRASRWMGVLSFPFFASSLCVVPRREVLVQVSSSTVAIAFTDWPVEDTSEAARCTDDGTLTPERAIPGAYESVCMDVPERIVPIHSENVPALRIQQRPSGPGSTGLVVWNSSLLLLRLLTHPVVLDWWKTVEKPIGTTTIVELGCGTGVASLAVAKSLLGEKGKSVKASVPHSFSIVATDGNPQVVELTQTNIEANGMKNWLESQSLPWGSQNIPNNLEGKVDVVVGSDLTYNPGAWPVLADTMATMLAPKGLVIYLSLGHSGFNVQAELEGFVAVAKSRGLTSILPISTEWPWRNGQGDAIPAETLLRSGAMSKSELEIMREAGGVRVLLLRAQ